MCMLPHWLSVNSIFKYYMCTQTYKLHVLCIHLYEHYSNIQLCGQGVSVQVMH